VVVNIRDRYTNGFVAGVIAGTVMSLLNILSFKLNFAQIRYIDFGAIITLGSQPNTFLEDIIGFSAHIAFTGLLGILFAYIIPIITSKHYLFKGVSFGIFVWFLTYTIPLLFKVPHLSKISASTALSNVITASVYGLILAYTLETIDKRIKQ